MRSRFWLGGPGVAPRRDLPVVGRAVPALVRRLVPLGARQAGELLVHCAQEMAHLAALLPELYAAFGEE